MGWPPGIGDAVVSPLESSMVQIDVGMARDGAANATTTNNICAKGSLRRAELSPSDPHLQPALPTPRRSKPRRSHYALNNRYVTQSARVTISGHTGRPSPLPLRKRGAGYSRRLRTPEPARSRSRKSAPAFPRGAWFGPLLRAETVSQFGEVVRTDGMAVGSTRSIPAWLRPRPTDCPAPLGPRTANRGR